MNFNPNANSLSLGPVSANGLETTPTADSSASATRIITRSDASCEADGGGGKSYQEFIASKSFGSRAILRK